MRDPMHVPGVVQDEMVRGGPGGSTVPGTCVSRNILRLATLSVAMLGMLLATTGCSISKSHKKALQVARYRGQQLEQSNSRLGQMEGQLANAHREQELAAARARELDDRIRLAQAGEQAEASEIAALRGELVKVQTDLAQARQVVADLGAEYDMMADQNRTLRLQAQTPAPAPMDTWSEQPRVGPSPAALAMQRDLQDRLRRYGLNSLPVEVRQDNYGERVAIVLPDAFDSGEATLHKNKDAVQAIVGLGRLIKETYPSAQVLVEGHTDSDPLRRTKEKWGTNEGLSRARADAVRELLTTAGLGGGQVSTAGFGAQRLLDPGSGKDSKSRNRRVEIYIAPNA
jgi:flagellar motor protein MotB